MNYSAQSERFKPNAKSCDWCKNYNKCFETCDATFFIFETRLTHRQDLKTLREGHFRYCKSYRYSKLRFNKWKQFYKENEEIMIF